MKKFLCIFLAFILLLAMAGCSEPDVRGEVTVEEEEFSFGSTSGNKYKNKFLGLSCKLPSEWEFYTDEQILEANSLAMDALGEEAAEAIKNATIIYDMFATNAETGSNMNLNLEKITAAQKKNLNLKQTIEAQFATIEAAYENMGYSNVQAVYTKVEVDGEKLDGAEITASLYGADFYCTLFCFVKGNYIANVTVCAFDDAEMQTILDYFQFD